jgi:adenylate cyclase
VEAPPLERKLVAILAADVEGYSRLMGIDEEGTLATLSAHRAITDALIAEHGGRICGTAGDSVLAEFASVFAAVQCAVDIQRAIAAANQALNDDRRMWFRIGINVGDVMVKDGDIFGDGVNIAARLEGLAEAGGICISRGVRDHIWRKLPYGFEDLGEQRVKNIARPIRVFRLLPDPTEENLAAAAEKAPELPDDLP